MSYPSLRFVDAPSEGAAVRLDVNMYGVTVDVATLHDGFSLGAPALAGEPGNRRRAWGRRQLVLPLTVEGERRDAVAVHRALAREVTRAEGWLRFQLDPFSPPVWFRTYATSPDAVSFESVVEDRDEDEWGFNLPVDADPFGVGEQVQLGPFVVSNHPESGSNQMRLDLPAIDGDVAAPAAVRVVKSGGDIVGPAVGVFPHDVGVFSPSSWGPAVGAAGADTKYLAGSYRQTTGALDAWETVATFLPASLPVGRYRMLLRVGGSVTDGGGVFLRWVASAPGMSSSVTSDAALVHVVDQVRWVDAGLVPWPLTDASALDVTDGTVVTLQVKRSADGGEFRFDDRLVMVPAREGATLWGARLDDAGDAATVRVHADSAARVAAATMNDTVMRSPETRGGWPLLQPGEGNVLFVAQNLDPTLVTGRHDDQGSTCEVTVTYRPQYLWGVA